jgi:hypothetical protein
MVLNQGTGKPMPITFFVVRATVADPAQRAAFDAATSICPTP